MTERKYFKPRSVTWWAFLVPLVAGGVKALAAALPDLAPVVAVIDEASGGMSATVLINVGAAGIGLRGAV